MKKITPILLIILLISCNKKHDISGSWFTCMNNGDYLEVHFLNGKYKNSSDFAMPSNWFKYEIHGDTLYQWSELYNGIDSISGVPKLVYKYQEFINKSLFQFVDDQLILTYLSWPEVLILNKFDHDLPNVNYTNKLQIATEKRGEEKNCQDIRTPEEIIQDSLSWEYFEF